MRTAEWEEWSRRHARVFGLTAKEDAAMLMEWCDLFAADGFTPAELSLATDAVSRDPPRYRSDHLTGLRQALKGVRRAAIPPPPQDCGTCEDCSGTGRVEVPLDGLTSPGGHVYPAETLGVVLCHCRLGHWLKEQGSKISSFDEYTSQRPHWRDDLKEIKARQRARNVASDRATRLDRDLGEILRRFRKD